LASEKAGVKIVMATPVVERGKGDKIYINTSGIGLIYENAKIGIEYIKPNKASSSTEILLLTEWRL
jgi:hydrogenase expression/formation protein HypE